MKQNDSHQLPPGDQQAGELHPRRHFLRTLAAGGMAAGFATLPDAGFAAADSWNCDIGACTESRNWDVLQKAGGVYVEEGVARLLNPKTPDADFDRSAAEFKTKGVPVRACNGFLPAELKLVGPEARHEEAVAYATKALERAKMLGVQFVVLGSGGARKVPEGFDKARADEQFIDVVGRIGNAAQAAGVTVAMESLNRTETNLGNTVRDCLRLINAINHPRVRLVADFYHMLREEESAAVLLEAGARIVHCHIAEKEGRTPPGTAGDDFKPFLRALRKIGFRGGISLECRWKNFAAEAASAISALKKQIEEVRAGA